MYRQLDRALHQTADADLARMAAAARQGELALGTSARQLEVLEDLRRRFDAAIAPVAVPPRAVVTAPARCKPQRTQRIPFLWEALAFAVGFAVSFLVT